MDKKVFNPRKYGMVICQYCTGTGYIHHPKRQCCLKCGGFGFVKKGADKDMNTFTNGGKCEGVNDG